MSSPARALQTAIVERLEEHAATSAYTWTDNGEASLPYGKVGEYTGSGQYTTSTEGWESTVTTHFWAQYTDEVQAMMGAYGTAIRDGVLDLTGDGFAALDVPDCEFENVVPDYDEVIGEIRHGVMRHRFMIQKL